MQDKRAGKPIKLMLFKSISKVVDFGQHSATGKEMIGMERLAIHSSA